MVSISRPAFGRGRKCPNVARLNVRLRRLVQTARSKARGLKSEIANAQPLVIASATLARRLTRELAIHQPTLSEGMVTNICGGVPPNFPICRALTRSS